MASFYSTLLVVVVASVLLLFVGLSSACVSWKPLVSHAADHTNGAGIEFGGALILAGGGSDNTIVEALSLVPRDTSWKYLPRLTQGRDQCSLASNGTNLFAIGGKSDGMVLQSVEVYSTTTRSWHTTSPLPLARYAATAAYFQNLLIVAGGFDQSGQPTATVQAMYPNNTWVQLSDMPQPRALHGSAVIDNGLYVFSGQTTATGDGSSFFYLDNNLQWALEDTFNLPLSSYAIAAKDGTARMVGGELLSHGPSTIDLFYNTRRHELYASDSLPLGGAGAFLAFHPSGETIYYFGGKPSANSNLYDSASDYQQQASYTKCR
jgi:hypothetical protein